MTGPKLTFQLKTIGIATLLLSAALSGCGFGGSNNNTTGGGSTGTGSTGTGSSSTSASYIYAADAADAGGAFAWKLDSTGNLTSVTGSPFLLPAGNSLNGALVANDGFVYIASRPTDTSGAALYTFKADSSSGALTQSGSPVSLTDSSDTNVRRMVLGTSGKTAYAFTQFNVIAIALNNGSPMLLNTQPASNGDVFGLAAGSQFVFAGTQDGNPKSGFQTPVVKRFAINSDGSLGAGQVVATLSDANIPKDVALDPSGRFLAVTTGMNNGEVTMFSVATDGSLTQLATASTNGKDGHSLAFDSTSKFLYALTNEEPDPEQESIMVFSVGSGGMLSLVQTFDMPSNVRNASLKVMNDFVIVGNDAGAGLASTVTVLHRDSASGQVSTASTANLSRPIGQIDVLSF